MKDTKTLFSDLRKFTAFSNSLRGRSFDYSFVFSFLLIFRGGGEGWGGLGYFPKLKNGKVLLCRRTPNKMGTRSRNHSVGVAPLFFAAQIEDALKFLSPKIKVCTKLVAETASGQEPRRNCFSRCPAYK